MEPLTRIQTAAKAMDIAEYAVRWAFPGMTPLEVFPLTGFHALCDQKGIAVENRSIALQVAQQHFMERMGGTGR